MDFVEAYIEFGEKVKGISEEVEKEASEKGWKYEFGTYYKGLGKFLAVYSRELGIKLEKFPSILCEGGERIKVESWDYVSLQVAKEGALDRADEIVKELGIEILDESEFGEYYEVVSSGVTLRFYPDKILAIIPKVKIREAEEKVKEMGIEQF